MFIRSDRLFLRPAWPEDTRELAAAIGDEGVVRNLVRVPWPYGAEDAQAFVTQPHEARFPRFLITLPSASGTRLIGGAGLHRDGSETTLGYWIARDHWGHGYATEATRALVCLAGVLGHRGLVADHFADNPASGRVLRKAGFRITGRTHLRHAQARGGEAPALGYEISLDAGPGGCGCQPMPRAA